MARARTLSPADRDHWARYASAVRPLPGRASIPPPEPPPQPGATLQPDTAAQKAAAAPQAKPARPLALVIGRHPPGVDNATWNRFRTGRLPATRSLDLHGMTAQRAFQALEHLLFQAAAGHIRCVEVITGRGQRSGEQGVLRRELPLWLNLPHVRPLILAAAHPHPANPGAVRLLLRRPR